MTGTILEKTDPSGKIHSIKYRHALNGQEKAMHSLLTKWTAIDWGGHKLLVEQKKWNIIPPDQLALPLLPCMMPSAPP